MNLDWWVGWFGGHIDISPVGPMVNTHVRKINELVRNEIRRYGFDHLCGFYCEPRSFPLCEYPDFQ